MTDQNLTEIIVILDRSGSMASVRTDAIGGFNTFLSEQKKQPGKALFTLCQFNQSYEIIHNGKSIQDVPELTTSTYLPGGYTALLDAIGRTILGVGSRLSSTPEDQRPCKVIVVILTDGIENASKEFTGDMIKKIIEEQVSKYNWQFIYLGANQDSFAVGGRLGIAPDFTYNYSTGPAGISGAYGIAGQSVSNYRSTGRIKPSSSPLKN